MLNKDRFKMFGTCEICHMEVIVQDCFRLGYDQLYCPGCYENIVHEGRPDPGILFHPPRRRHVQGLEDRGRD